MKKTFFIPALSTVSVFLIAVCLSVFNITLKNKRSGEMSALRLSNIKSAQASAFEEYCDGTSSSSCKFSVPGLTLVGSGNLIMYP